MTEKVFSEMTCDDIGEPDTVQGINSEASDDTVSLKTELGEIAPKKSSSKRKKK